MIAVRRARGGEVIGASGLDDERQVDTVVRRGALVGAQRAHA